MLIATDARRLPAWLLLIALAQGAAAQVERGPRHDLDRFTVIRAGKVITVSGKEIENGTVVINNGKITQVGGTLDYPLNARVIEAPDGVVMPGLIHPGTRAGLPGYRRGGVNAHLTAKAEWIPAAARLDDFIAAGFTSIAVVPDGAGFPGRATVRRTAGPADLRELRDPAYVRVAADRNDIRNAFKKADEEIEKVRKAVEAHEKKQKEAAEKAKEQQGGGAGDKPPQDKPKEDGKQGGKDDQTPASQPASQPAFEPPPIPPPYRPLVDLIEKKEGVRALFELSSASDYAHLVELLADREIAHDVAFNLSRAADLDFALETLGERKPRVVLPARTYVLPYSAYVNPLVERVAAAGCEVTLAPLGDSRSALRDHLARVAELVRDGLDRRIALAALTTHPAALLGIDQRVGAIETDREADLIILNADPFAPGATVTHVLIAGEVVYEAEEPARHE